MSNDPEVSMHPNGLPFEETCSHLRQGIKAYARLILDAKNDHPIFKGEADGVRDDGEMKANLTLAYRHLEDAAMRLGKAIQAKGGGKSVYNK
jgi:hypothetical protein